MYALSEYGVEGVVPVSIGEGGCWCDMGTRAISSWLLSEKPAARGSDPELEVPSAPYVYGRGSVSEWSLLLG